MLLLALAAGARADEPKEKEDEPPKPYTEGWHGGSPPGEHATGRVDLWYLAYQRTSLEVGHNQRTFAVSSNDLGQPTHGAAGGLGLEVYTGKTGWFSIDWWTVQTRGLAPIRRDGIIDGTTFPQGTVVASEVTQHLVKLRDGLDIRFRVPVDQESWVDFNFGPVTALVIRYESWSLHAPGGTPREDGALLGVSLVPGGRAGVDFHFLDGFIVRVGSDFDLLPHLDHNPLSFTREPSLDAWVDARAYLAVRFMFLEVSGGWRYFRSLASGGHIRQAETQMRGAFGEVAVRF